MFKDKLLSAQKLHKPIAVYTNTEETDRFTFGFVVGISNDDVVIGSITPIGFYDGFLIKKYSDIYRIDQGDRYGEKVYRLYQLRQQKHPDLDLKTGNFILDILYFACKRHLVVSLVLCDSERDYVDVQGFVSGVEENTIMIRPVDEYGNIDGESIIPLDYITMITCDSETEAALKLLAEATNTGSGSVC